MTENPDTSVADHTLRLRRGMRRDYAAVIERQPLLMKAITDLRQAVDSLARDTRDGFTAVRSDIITLENQNLSRHGELLDVMRRLDEVGFPVEAD